MADSQNTFPLKRSQFSCPKCKGQEGSGAFFFFALAEAITQNEHGEYVAACPQCGGPGEELWYMKQCRMTIGRKTGPTTAAGKAKCAMNGYLTGSSYATGAIPRNVPPAKPGKYAECESCQDFAECKEEVDRAKGTCRYVACHRIGEVIAKYRNAHLTGDPESLRLQAADNQANTQRVMNQCFKAIFDEGVFIESVVVSNGAPVYVLEGDKATPLTEKKINPAINESIKILEKMGFGLADWTLTPKSKEAKAAFEGYLAGRAAEKGVSADEFLEQHKKDMKAMHAALERGNVAMQNDETLKEAQADEQSDPEMKDA